MAIRLSGLNSGLDTDSIIQELVKAKSIKKETMVKEQKKLSWKQDAWKSLNSKIYSLYSKSLSDMRLQSDYTKKKTTSSSSAVTVLTGAEAPNCVQTMKIDKMAKAGYLTGAKLTAKEGKLTGDSKVMEALDDFSTGGKFTVTINGESKDIEVGESTTINNIVSALREAGVNANFDETNQRFYISAKKMGKENDFTLTASNTDGLNVMSKLGIASSLSTDTNTQELYLKYANLLGEDGTLLTESEDFQKILAETVKKNIATNNYAQVIINAEKAAADMKTELESAQTDFEKYNGEGYVQAENGSAETDPEKIQAAIDNLDKEAEDYATKLDAYTGQLNDAKHMSSMQSEIAAQEKIASDARELYAPGEDGADGEAKQKLIDAVTEEIRTQAVNSKAMLEAYAAENTNTDAIRVAGDDSRIILNNAEYTSTGNTFEINGLTLTINNITSDEITLSTADDTDGIYDKIKGFLKEYNSLINEMDKLYNADSAKDYAMLSDDEKESMSDDEVKEWETKIKDSLLRRDSTLSTVSEAMKNIMLSGVTMKDGTQMYLSDFGISTLGYFNSAENEKNAYHIDGDSDDESTSTKTDKLKTAIANNPDTVSEFFATLSRTLYEKLDDLMESTDYSSAFTVYNDKQMKTEYDDYKTKISEQEDKIADYEDAYYKKFTAMETAMAKLNSQQSSLSSLFGS